MNVTEYDSWTKYHRAMFQMKSDDDLPMFAAWMPSLREFTLAEARDASLAIAADPGTAGKFRTEHLALIRQKIRIKRAEVNRAFRKEAERHGEVNSCGVCRGIGMAHVPHVKSVVDGLWIYPFATMVVSCSCNRGGARQIAMDTLTIQQDFAGTRRRVRMMTLAEYEFSVPDWPAIFEAREVQRQSEKNAGYYAKRADKENPITNRTLSEVVAGIGHEPIGD